MEATENTKRDQVAQRKEKLEQMRKAGFKYPNHTKPTIHALELHGKYEGMSGSGTTSFEAPLHEGFIVSFEGQQTLE